MRIAATIAAAMLLGASAPPALAQERAPDPVPIEEWSPERVGAMGQAIFDQDRAAWLATDALLAHLNGVAPSDLRGWIVAKDGEDQRVRFVRMDGETLKPGWDIVVRQGRAGPGRSRW